MSKRITIEYDRDEAGRIIRELRREDDGRTVRRISVYYDYDESGQLVKETRTESTPDSADIAESAKFREQQEQAMQRLHDWLADLDRISVQFAADAACQLAAMPVKVRTHVRRDPQA